MNRFFLIGTLVGVLCLQSCTDDDLLNRAGTGIPATPGTPVTFAAGLEPEQPATRTIYGDRDGNVFPIYWSHPGDETGSKTYDDIYIYSSTGNGSGGSRSARYMVLPARPKFEGMAPVRIVGDEANAIVVAETGEQEIYAFYPYDAVVNGSSNTTGSYVYVNMPINQKVYVPSTDKENVYYADCDMNLCYMKAGGKFTLEEDKAVQLQFKPWSSVLDITIPGPTSGDACIVTDVTVKSTAISQGTFNNSSGQYTQAPIAGRTQMYLNTAEVGFTNGFDQTSCSEIVNVDVCQEGSDEKGFVLESGKKLNLKVFLSPSATVKALDIEVHTASGFTEGGVMRLPISPRVWVKRLEVENLSDALLAQGQIHPVVMPQIGSKDSGVSDLSQWMSELPDNAKITNLSIPGAYAAEDFFIQNASYANVQAKQYVGQTEDIASQFNAGIRAFNLHLDAIYGGRDPILGNGMSLTLPSGYATFGDFLSRLADVLKARSSEFCIVEVNLNQQSLNYSFLLELFAKYCQRLEVAGLLPEKKDEGYTVGDLRGKMLLQVKLDGDPKLYQQSGNFIERRWNYGFNYEDNTSTDGFSPEDISMISPLSNIERLFMNANPTTIYSWDTYPGVTPFNPEDYGFDNAKVTVDYLCAPYSWSNITKATGKCPPVMLSYYTTTTWQRATLTPVAFGKIGDLQYTPRYPDEDSFLNRTSGLVNDQGFVRDTQNAPVFSEYDRNSSSTSQAYKKESAGLRWMHAYVLWKNMEHTGISDGMLGDNIVRTYTDMRLSEYVREDNQYVMFRDNPDQSYWLHQSDNWRETQTYDKRKTVNDGMWKSCPQFGTVSNGEYANRSMVDVFTQLFNDKVFISTWLGFGWRYFLTFGCLHDFNDNRKVVTDWIGYVTTNSAADELTINATYRNKPLGAVYMPYVPNRLTVLDETGLAEGLDKEMCLVGKDVRKIIDMLIKHSKELN